MPENNLKLLTLPTKWLNKLKLTEKKALTSRTLCSPTYLPQLTKKNIYSSITILQSMASRSSFRYITKYIENTWREPSKAVKENILRIVGKYMACYWKSILQKPKNIMKQKFFFSFIRAFGMGTHTKSPSLYFSPETI